MKILVADDDALNRDIMTRMIMKLGHEAVAVPDGESALKTSDGTFDIVFLDLRMPVMDGMTAAANLRKNPANAALKIVALTGDDEEGIESLSAKGFDEVVLKPVGIDDVRSIIGHYEK